jgi:hypothetical protein
VPIKDLQRNDADVEQIFVIKNMIHLMNQTDDPIFSSHKKMIFSFAQQGAMESYLSDDQATPVACAQQVS